MKHAGGMVYLFDEGDGFYFNNSEFHRQYISMKDRFYLGLYNMAFKLTGVPAYARKGFEGRMFACINDQYIDGMYSRMKLPVDRSLKIFGYKNLLNSHKADEPKDKDVVLLFAANLKTFGVGDEERKLMKTIVAHLSSVFHTVLIKIHPSDVVSRNDNFNFYQELIEKYGNVLEVTNGMTGNDAIEQYRPQLVVGALGATLFDAFFFGCQPVFLFHLLPPTREFRVCDFVLRDIGYQYISKVEDISPGYQSGVDADVLLYREDIKMPWESGFVPNRNQI
jgi:hypothetical protein